jgi:ubiquinone/menaquinone biosynthesis C-methylase UbiE
MCCKREKFKIDIRQNHDWLGLARQSFDCRDYNKAFDVYEQLYLACPDRATEILAEAYDKFKMISNQSRYILYQSRYYNFNIKPNDKVLDIGSGNRPLHLATHLADIAIEDNHHGRAGVPFKYIDNKPVYECNIEALPFKDKEFDFVYCSHVMEHVTEPKKACKELMRVAKRGYIETPAPHKDMWLNTAKISHHQWEVESIDNKLIFTEFSQQRIEGLGSNILLDMHCSPQTIREKAFSALIYLKSDLLNTMLLWEDSFDCEVHKLKCDDKSDINTVIATDDMGQEKLSAEELLRKGCCCLEKSDPSGALKYCDEAIRIDSILSGLHFARAIALAQIGKLSMAREACQAELRLQPKKNDSKKFLERIEQAIQEENQVAMNRRGLEIK